MSITVSFYIIQCVLEDGFVTDSNGGGYSEIGSPGAGDLPCGPNNIVHNHHFVTVINTTFLNNKATVAGALSMADLHDRIT